MSVKINIHKTHRQFTNDLDAVEVAGSNVGDCLNQLVKQYPDLKDALFDKKGKLLNVVEIYVNMESAYPEELAKPVKDGDELTIVPFIGGG